MKLWTVHWALRTSYLDVGFPQKYGSLSCSTPRSPEKFVSSLQQKKESKERRELHSGELS